MLSIRTYKDQGIQWSYYTKSLFQNRHVSKYISMVRKAKEITHAYENTDKFGGANASLIDISLSWAQL